MVEIASEVVASKNHLASHLGDEVVILSLDNGTYYGLNALAAFVWDLVQQPVRVEDLHASILEHYAVEHGSAETDLLDLLHDFHKLGLIEVQ